MEINLQSTQDVIDKYYRGGKKDGRPRTASITILSADDIINEYYKGENRATQRPRQASTSIEQLAVDNNNSIFSFNFGLSLLNFFIKIEFGDRDTGTFGLSNLEKFIV